MADDAGETPPVNTEPQARHVIYCGGAVSPSSMTEVSISSVDNLL